MSFTSLNTTMVRYAAATLAITSIGFSALFYALKIVPLPEEEMAKELVRIKAELNRQFDFKVEGMKDMAAAISGYQSVQKAVVDEFDRDLAVEQLSGIREHFSQITDFKNIQVHLFAGNKTSLVKSWNPSSFGQQVVHPLVDAVFAQKRVTGGITIGATSIALVGFSPVMVDGEMQGALSVIGGFKSVVTGLENEGKDWVFLLDKTYLEQRYGRVPFVVESNRAYGDRYIVANNNWYSEELQAKFLKKNIPLAEGEGTRTVHFDDEKKVYLDFPAYDELGQVMGRHLVETSDQELENRIAFETESLVISLAVSIFSVIISVAMIGWVVRRKVVKPISEMAERVSEIEKTGDFSLRVPDKDTSEVGLAGRSTNALLIRMQTMISETNQVVDQMAQGHFDARITAQASGDLEKLKQGVNASADAIAKTMQTLRLAMVTMADGHFSETLDASLPGEYGEMIVSAQQTMANLNEIVSDILRVMAGMEAGRFDGRIRAVAQGDLLTLKTSMNDSLSHLNQAMTAIRQVLEAQASGDLSQRISADFKGDLDAVKTALNSTADRLSTTMREILLVSSDVSQSSGEVAEGSLDLSQRTQEMAASIEQTAASMEELTSTVKQNVDSAQMANQLASDARSKAIEGEKVAKEAIVAMQSVNESSAKIADIIVLIDGIAFQTNLLALNAAVEAARAGEHGRGFAVVAGEVRSLAQKSAQASQEIKQLIENSVTVSEEGSALVSRTGETLESITQSVRRVADIVAEISHASIEQGRGIEQINQAITQLDSVTQQNAAMVEETSAAADSMSQQSENLKQQVSFFKV